MSILRPECCKAYGRAALPYDTALFLIHAAVARRRKLIHGKLHDGKGGHCSMGAFWEDNPEALVNSSLTDEVAAVNDSLPKTATQYERWRKVNAWLKWKLQVLAGKTKAKRATA